MSADPAANVSQFLLDLAAGKYDKQWERVSAVLMAIGVFDPPVGEFVGVVNALLALNKAFAPTRVVSDGKGGWVPASQSHCDPATGRFVHWDVKQGKYVDDNPLDPLHLFT